jgi:hypothetical protein
LNGTRRRQENDLWEKYFDRLWIEAPGRFTSYPKADRKKYSNDLRSEKEEKELFGFQICCLSFRVIKERFLIDLTAAVFTSPPLTTHRISSCLLSIMKRTNL